ncbi:hypothetical protein NUW54_g5875 [Trametes sanguinea]|uniref:Uncharacterized protein n=1 Tax=Trametes sanguinea TaxID=158606 RepID=A0ACC1PTX0_9APHY|nr:hypothetical protein NUW54_g5875 [Trametes sanguinea]
MFIAIIGTRLAGKTTVENFLIMHKGFVPVRLVHHTPSKDIAGDGEFLPAYTDATSPNGVIGTQLEAAYNRYRVSFLSLASPASSSLPSPAPIPEPEQGQPLWFHKPGDLLAHVTRNWRTHFVTTDLDTLDVLNEFLTRPFVLVVSVDAPLLTRYQRSLELSNHKRTLEEFIKEHDIFYYGPGGHDQEASDLATMTNSQRSRTSFRSLSQLASVHVVNSFETISGLQDHLMEVNLLNPERLRPGWDTYFMRLASLASQRSNCMKRRVGAILVRNARVVSTGYNGTPRGLKNCNEGGCTRCNTASETPDECLCLHAEENALLEAGRVGEGAILYCNTCPCLKCTIKIIQSGIKEVVYNLSYKVDDASAALFTEAGVILRRHANLA